MEVSTICLNFSIGLWYPMKISIFCLYFTVSIITQCACRVSLIVTNFLLVLEWEYLSVNWHSIIGYFDQSYTRFAHQSYRQRSFVKVTYTTISTWSYYHSSLSRNSQQFLPVLAFGNFPYVFSLIIWFSKITSLLTCLFLSFNSYYRYGTGTDFR